MHFKEANSNEFFCICTDISNDFWPSVKIQRQTLILDVITPCNDGQKVHTTQLRKIASNNSEHTIVTGLVLRFSSGFFFLLKGTMYLHQVTVDKLLPLIKLYVLRILLLFAFCSSKRQRN